LARLPASMRILWSDSDPERASNTLRDQWNKRQTAFARIVHNSAQGVRIASSELRRVESFFGLAGRLDRMVSESDNGSLLQAAEAFARKGNPADWMFAGVTP
jgi:hypothetical protein